MFLHRREAMMNSSDALNAKIAQSGADLAEAQKEVAQLLQELNAGTLNRQALQTGLLNLQQSVTQISSHIPTFNSDIVHKR
jgi:chromosome segregation ATPase